MIKYLLLNTFLADSFEFFKIFRARRNVFVLVLNAKFRAENHATLRGFENKKKSSVLLVNKKLQEKQLL